MINFIKYYFRQQYQIHEGLNVVENWNSANGFIFYGKSGEVASNRLEDQELSVLSLHLLQLCLVYMQRADLIGYHRMLTVWQDIQPSPSVKRVISHWLGVLDEIEMHTKTVLGILTDEVSIEES